MLKLQRFENNELTSIDMQQICDTNLNKTLHFELNPIWLLIENINCNVASDIKLVPIRLEFASVNYKLLMIYIHSGSDHFKGVLCLEKKYFLIDDLHHRMED